MPDVIVVGGGVIGLSIAWELAGAGLDVCLLDQSEVGQEASWAGAGMIPPGDLHHSATHQLAVLSAQRWPEISAALRTETGIDNGYRRCGGLLLEDSRSIAEIAAAWSRLHVHAERLGCDEVRKREPAWSATGPAAVWIPDMAQVRNPWHLQALHAACRQRGVTFRTQEQVIGWKKQNQRIAGITTSRGKLSAAEYVVATGAWTAPLLAPLDVSLPIEPVHGQIVLLRGEVPLFRHVIEQGAQYLVPRTDGRVLIGATEERIGFEKRNTQEVTAELREFARQTIPALENLPVEKTWSGLRPWCGLGHPCLGRLAEFPNLFVAAGHFRAGLSNSPGTALVMRQLILNEPPTIDLSGFHADGIC